MSAPPINNRLDGAIRSAIETYPGGGLAHLVKLSGGPYVVKYMPAKWGSGYIRRTARQFKISNSPGFTWGTAVYLTPLCFPISGAIYGRVGVVAEFDPSPWQIFDATRPAHLSLYLDWIRTQPLYLELAATAHAQVANQFLRDEFRRIYRIDCVLFRPDEFDRTYTDVSADVWMAVTDWKGSEIQTDRSSQFTQLRFAVLLGEEFDHQQHQPERQAMIGPLTARQPNAQIAADILNAYQKSQWILIDA